MTENPNLTTTRDQIRVADPLADTAVERELFDSGTVEDVPTLPQSEEEEIDTFLDEAAHGDLQREIFERGDDFDQMIQKVRSNVAAAEKRLEAEGGRYEQIIKDVAADRRAEQAKELAEHLKEINEHKRAGFKEAASKLLGFLKKEPVYPFQVTDAEVTEEREEKRRVATEAKKAREDAERKAIEEKEARNLAREELRQKKREAKETAWAEKNIGDETVETKANVALAQEEARKEKLEAQAEALNKIDETTVTQETKWREAEEKERQKELAAKAEKQAAKKERRAAFIDNLKREVTHFGTTAEKRREAVREALRKNYRAPEKPAKPQPEQAKPKEPELTMETLVPQIEERLQARLKDIEKKVQEIRRTEQAPIDSDELKDLMHLKGVVEADLAAMDADAAEGKKYEDALKAAEAELAAEEAKVDQAKFEAAKKALEQAREKVDRANTLKEEKNEAWGEAKAEIAQLEKQLGKVEPESKRPIEIRLQALNTHELGLREEARKADRDAKKAEAFKQERVSDVLALSKDTILAKNKVVDARAQVSEWLEKKGEDNDPAMIAAQNEWKRLEQERRTQKEAEEARRTAAIESRFEGAKGEALDKTLSRLSDKQLAEQVKAFEGVAANEPGNPVLAEMAKRYRTELDRRNAAAEEAKKAATTKKEAGKEATETKKVQDRRDDEARDREINAFKIEYSAYLGQLEAAKKMLASKNPEEASMGAQIMQELETRQAELDKSHRELKTYVPLTLIKPRSPSNAVERRWQEMYGTKEDIEIEGVPTEDETLARLKRMNTPRLEKRYETLTTSEKNPSPNEQQEINLIKGILINRRDKSAAWDAKWDAISKEREKAEMAGERDTIEFEKLNTLSADHLEKILSELHTTIAQAEVPSDDDVRRSETIERILLERASKEPDILDAEASRIATLSKPLSLTERDAFVQDLQNLSFKDLVERSKEDLEFFDVDPTNPGFSQRAELYKQELARRMEDEDTQGKLSRNLQRTLTRLARTHDIASSETRSTAIDAKRAGEQEAREQAEADALLNTAGQSQEKGMTGKRVLAESSSDPNASATMNERGDVRYQGEVSSADEAPLGKQIETFQKETGKPVSEAEAALEAELKARVQAREADEDPEIIKAQAKALFKETPAEKEMGIRELAAEVPLSELLVMIQGAKNTHREKQKTGPDPDGWQLAEDLEKIFKDRIDTPEKIRAEIEKDKNPAMQARLEKLLPADEETSAA